VPALVTVEPTTTLVTAVASPTSPVASTRTCPICFDSFAPAAGETFCGVHLYCPECAGLTARKALQAGVVPRCPDCHAEVEPYAARRLLRTRDMEHYLCLKLWSNDGVAACPRCHEGVYEDNGIDSFGQGRCRSARCPACEYDFCVECRNAAHPSIEDCEEAARHRKHQRKGKKHQLRNGRDDGAPSLSTLAKLLPINCANPSVVNEFLSSSSELDEAATLLALGCKPCPRCRSMVQKADDGCDHMTCSRCTYEFCWSCLADRVAIFAHGNHLHRPSCQFYREHIAPPEYLPDRCRRCAYRGCACALRIGSRGPSRDEEGDWFQGLVKLLTLRSCQMVG